MDAWRRRRGARFSAFPGSGFLGAREGFPGAGLGDPDEISALEGNMLGASPKLVMREKNRGVGEEGGKSEGKGKEG